MICFATFRLDTESRQFLGDFSWVTFPFNRHIGPVGRGSSPRRLIFDRSIVLGVMTLADRPIIGL